MPRGKSAATAEPTIDDFDPSDYVDSTETTEAPPDAEVAPTATGGNGEAETPKRRGRPPRTTTTPAATATALRIDVVLNRNGAIEKRVLVVRDTPSAARAQAKSFFETVVVEAL